jgi:hypothetical protein
MSRNQSRRQLHRTAHMTNSTLRPQAWISFSRAYTSFSLIARHSLFFRSLESPCLSHNIPFNHDVSTGHALTVSATLLHHHPSPLEQCLSSSHRTTWHVSTLGIERLLQLSESVPLFDGELTPVQAWDQVRKHPQFGTLGSEGLEGLKAALLESVRCYG